MEKNRFLKILCYGTYVVGFQTMVIMDLWGMAFHAMVVIGLIPALLFISTWACCEMELLVRRLYKWWRSYYINYEFNVFGQGFAEKLEEDCSVY